MKTAVLFVTVLAVSSLTFAQSQVPAKFWGVQFNVDCPRDQSDCGASSDYPLQNGPAFQTFRFWDTGTSWYQIMKNGAGTYDFSEFDNWMNDYVYPNNFDVIYTIGKTPNFISAYKADTCGGNPNNFPGSCVPPKDVLCTGSGVAATGGSDDTLIGFVSALWGHIVSSGWSGRQWYFEVWNEPNNANGGFWDNGWINGTYCPGDVTASRRILARIAYDVRQTLRSASSNAQVLSPPPSGAAGQAQSGTWWYNYLSGDGGLWGLNAQGTCSGYFGTPDPCGGGQFADVIAIHEYLGSYPNNNESPDQICCGTGTAVSKVRSVLETFSQVSKPLFLTEGSWTPYCNAKDGCFANFDPVSWTGRYYTLVVSQGQVQRFAWYNYDTDGPFWCSAKYNDYEGCSQTGKVSTSGTALYQMQSLWHYDGATFAAGGCQSTAACSGNFRACGLTEGSTNTTALAAWYDQFNSSCSYTPPPPGPNLTWVDYRDLHGTLTAYTGGPVELTNSPLLFEASPSNSSK